MVTVYKIPSSLQEETDRVQVPRMLILTGCISRIKMLVTGKELCDKEVITVVLDNNLIKIMMV